MKNEPGKLTGTVKWKCHKKTWKFMILSLFLCHSSILWMQVVFGRKCTKLTYHKTKFLWNLQWAYSGYFLVTVNHLPLICKWMVWCVHKKTRVQDDNGKGSSSKYFLWYMNIKIPGEYCSSLQMFSPVYQNEAKQNKYLASS